MRYAAHHCVGDEFPVGDQFQRHNHKVGVNTKIKLHLFPAIFRTNMTDIFMKMFSAANHISFRHYRVITTTALSQN